MPLPYPSRAALLILCLALLFLLGGGPLVIAQGSDLPPPTATVPPISTAPAIETPAPVGDSYEPDDRPEQAHQLVQGETQARSYATPGDRSDVDWVWADLKVGRWEIAARTTYPLYDPALQYGDLVADDEEGKNAILVVTIEEDTRALIRVYNLGRDDPAGSYSLSLRRLSDEPTATPVPPPPTVATGDAYEPDAPPAAAPYIGPQQRTFAPNGDEDWVRVLVKAHRPVTLFTTNLAGGADTELFAWEDADGMPTASDPFLGSDDDGGGGYASMLTVGSDHDMWVTVKIANRGAGWSNESRYLFRAELYVPPTPLPATATLVPTKPPATPYPTYTPYPTGTPAPAATIPPPPIPYPTAWHPAAPPSGNGSSGSSSGGAESGGGNEAPTSGAPEVPPGAVAVLDAGAVMTIEIFVDINGDGRMNWGEEVEDTLVYATTPDGRWTNESYSVGGKAVIALAGVPASSDLVVLVPYLHLSAAVPANSGSVASRIPLVLPIYPAYLP